MFMEHSANEKCCKQQKPFWLQPSNTIKKMHIHCRSQRCPAEDLLQQQYYTIHDRMFLKVIYCLESVIFFLNSLRRCSLSERNTFTLRAKLCQMQPYIQKVCITKPLVPKPLWTITSNGQSPLSLPRFNFFISAVKSIIRGSKQWPVARGTSAPKYWLPPFNNEDAIKRPWRTASQGTGEHLVCDWCWKTREATNKLLPMGKLPSVPSVLSQLP